MADLDLEEILKETLEVVTKALDADAASFFLKDPTEDEIVLFASFRGESRVDLIRIPFKAQSIVGKVLLDNAPYLSRDTTADPYHSKEAEKSTGYAIRNLIALPFELRLRPDRVDHLVLEVMNRNNHFRLESTDVDLIRLKIGENLKEHDSSRVVDEVVQRVNDLIEERSSGRLEPGDLGPLVSGYSEKERSVAERVAAEAMTILGARVNRTFSDHDLKLCKRLMKVMMNNLQGAVADREETRREDKLEALLQGFLTVEEKGRTDQEALQRLRKIVRNVVSDDVWLWSYRGGKEESSTTGGGGVSLPTAVLDLLSRMSRSAGEGDRKFEEHVEEGLHLLWYTAGGNSAALVGRDAFEYDARLALQILVVASATSNTRVVTASFEQNFLDQFALPMLELDAQMRVLRFNPAFEALARRNGSEVKGQEWQAVLPLLKRLGIGGHLNRLAHSTERSSIMYDVHGHSADGSRAVYVLGQSRLGESSGRRMLWVVDVTSEYWIAPSAGAESRGRNVVL